MFFQSGLPEFPENGCSDTCISHAQFRAADTLIHGEDGSEFGGAGKRFNDSVNGIERDIADDLVDS